MPSAGAVVPPLINPIRRIEGKPSSHINTTTYIDLETETPGCKIYFSTDGTKPNPFQMKIGGRETTFKFRGPFTMKPGKRTLKCIAVSRDGLQESNVVTKTFMVDDVGPPNDDDNITEILENRWNDESPLNSGTHRTNTWNKKKKNFHNTRKEAWGDDDYDYVPPTQSFGEPTNGHITSEKDPDHLINSVHLPDGPFNPTNYSGTQVNFWGVAPPGGVPMPGNINPLGAMSLPYGTTPNQLGCMTNHMLANMNQPRLSLQDLKKLMQDGVPQNVPAIEPPREPELKPESPGAGDWKGNIEHIYAHLLDRCRNIPSFRNAVGDPRLGRIEHADLSEEDNAYLLTIAIQKPGIPYKKKPKPKPVPVAEPLAPAPAPPPPKPKPSLKAVATAIKTVAKKEPVKPKVQAPPKPEPKKDPFFVTEEYMAEGTLKPWEFFNADRDCEALRAAMKGVGTDERVIIDIMGYRISTQRQEICTMFKTMFGKNLREELAGENSGDFKEILKALCMAPDEYDASEIKRAIKGLGTDEDALIEILCTRTNAQIKAINEAYTRLYDKDMLKQVKSDTSGDFKQLLTFQIQGQRNESPEYDRTEAENDAKNLYTAGEGKKWGTDEATFNQIICRRSFAHLRAVFEEYAKLSKRSIEEAIKSEFSGDIKSSLLTVVKVIQNKPGYFAERLHKAMKGAGTDDSAMVRIIVSRCEIDMVQIKAAFQEQFKGTLGEWIKDDTSGDLREMLLALIGDRPAPIPTAEEIEEAEGEPELEEVEEEVLPENPTLVPADPFNPKADCEVLMKAMKGLGTDEKAIIGVVCKRSVDQRLELIKTYREVYGKDLKKEIHSEISGDFRNIIMGLFMSAVEFDAEQLRKTMKGAGTDEDGLLEILCTRSNERIEEIKAKYKNLFNRKLEEDLMSETSGHLKRLLVSMVQGNRPGGNIVDRRKARKDAKDIMEAGEKKLGTDESRFNVILCSRSFPQLRATFEEYAKIANKEIEDTIKSELSGDLQRGMLILVGCVRNRHAQFADTLKRSMKGLGTKDDSLIRTVVSRCEVDMVQIKEVFVTRHGQPLGQYIYDDTSGDYRRSLLTLIGEEAMCEKKK